MSSWMASIRGSAAKANPFKNREELSELFMDDTELMKAMASVQRLREISKVRLDLHSPCPVALRVHNNMPTMTVHLPILGRHVVVVYRA